MKVFGIICAVFIGLFVLSALGTVMGIITLPWFKLDTQIQTNRDIITKTFDAANVLHNYHWFKEKQGAITALEATIPQSIAAKVDFEANAGPRKDWTFEDKQEDNRLTQVILGQKAQYNSLVQEYNARAKEADRTIFKDDLPTFFTLKPFSF